MDDLYTFADDHVGRKSYVSVRGHARSIPKYKTYRGVDGRNYLLPEYGGTWDGLGNQATAYMPDKDGYLSPLDGKFVEGRNAHRDHMKRHNVIEAGDVRMGHMLGEKVPLTRAHFDIRRAIAELNA